MTKYAIYTIVVDDKLWEEFKLFVTKDKTLNDAIVELIKKHVEEKRSA